MRYPSGAIVAVLAALLLGIGPAAAQPKPKPVPAEPAGTATRPLALDEAYAPDAIAVGDVDRVLYRTRLLTIIDAFGMGSLRQTGDIFVLLRDGTAFLHEWSFPVTDLDIALSRQREPERWFRWSEGPDGPVLARGEGETIDLGQAAVLAPMTGAAPFAHVWFSVDAASGPRPDDGAYRFAADGTVRHDRVAPTFLADGRVDIGAASIEARSPYRFEGYALILETPDGDERHFFAAFAGGDPAVPPAVVIDGAAYFTP